MKIKESVGGKANHGNGESAKIVQDLLNKHASAVGFKKLDVDGLVGPRTIKAIGKFQDAAVPEIKRADGRVDPGKFTIAALNRSPGEVAKLIKEGAQSERVPGVVMKVKGKEVGVPYNEYAKLARKALDDIRRGVYLDCKMKVVEARSLWDHFDELNKDSWVDDVIHAFGRFSLPPQSVIKNAEAALAKWDAALKSGDFKRVQSAMVAANKPINEAIRQMNEYRAKVIGQAGGWITGLEITKTTSFAVVGTFATGGAGSVAAAAGWGAAIAVTESGATEVGKYSAGDKKQTLGTAMQSMTIDACLGVLTGAAGKAEVVKQMSKVGSPIASRALAKQAPKLSKGVSPAVMAEYLEKYLVGPGYAVLEKSVTETVKSMKIGEKKMTWDKILEHSISALAGATVFKKLETVISKKLPDDMANDVFKGKLDKHLQPFFKKSGVTKQQLFKENSKAVKDALAKAVGGPLGVLHAKAVEEALKKGKGTESAEQIHKAAMAIFMNHAAALKLMAETIEKQVGPRIKKK